MASLSNENAGVPDAKNSNRKFDISLEGTRPSRTTNLSVFVLTPAVRICASQKLEHKGEKNQLPVDVFDVHDRQSFKRHHVRKSGFQNPESGKICLCNPESWALESTNQLKESQYRLGSGIQVPRSKNPESRTWNPTSMEWNPESKTVLDSLT